MVRRHRRRRRRIRRDQNDNLHYRLFETEKRHIDLELTIAIIITVIITVRTL